MNEYSIVDISNSLYDGRGIRLINGKTSVFYKKKNAQLQNIIIIRGNSLEIKDGEVVLSLSNNLDINDVKKIVVAFFSELFKIGINVKQREIKVIANSKLEEEQMSQILSSYGISFNIEKSQSYLADVSNQVVKSRESTQRIIEDNSSVNMITSNVSNSANMFQDKKLENINTVYYVDNDDFKIYDSSGLEIGMLGKDGYLIDYTNNILTRDGNAIGYVDDIKGMEKVKENDKSMVKVRKKKEVSNEISFDKAGFVSLPIILLVLSVLFFGASIVLYFMQ